MESLRKNFPPEGIPFSNLPVVLQGAEVSKDLRHPKSFVMHKVPGVVVEADKIKRPCTRQPNVKQARVKNPSSDKRLDKKVVEHEIPHPNRKPVPPRLRRTGIEDHHVLGHTDLG